MNRFIRLGNIILNLDHVIEIRYEPAFLAARYDGEEMATERRVLWITTTEIGSDQSSRVLRFLDNDALTAWEFLRSNLTEINGKIMRYLDVTPS